MFAYQLGGLLVALEEVERLAAKGDLDLVRLHDANVPVEKPAKAPGIDSLDVVTNYQYVETVGEGG